MNGKDNDSYIFGGDIRLFDVSVDEERVELAEKIQIYAYLFRLF